ncbi:MAG: UbiA prenyltransferase family protein [Pseudomonadota bacterium]
MMHDLHLPRPSAEHLLRRISDHLALLRPSHWAKSLIAIPIGPVLMLDQATMPALVTLAGTVTMFILASAAVYVVNDLSDIERDRLHPAKSSRPLASGAVSPRTALWMLAGLVGAMAALSFALPALLTAIVVLYLACNLTYSLWLKHVPIVEMLIVAAGFALRTASGYVAFGAVPDPWVIATVLAGSLLLTVGKRRGELRRVQGSEDHRPVLAHYTEPLLDAYLLIAAIACFGSGLAAMMRVFEDANLQALFFVSLPFAIYLFKRYLLLAFAGRGTSNPTKLLLADRTIHIVLLVWALALGLGAAVGDLAFEGLTVAHATEVAL